MHRAEIQSRTESFQVSLDSRSDVVCECLMCSAPIYRNQVAKWLADGSKFSTSPRPRGPQRFPQGAFTACWMCASCRDFVDEVLAIHLTNDLSTEARLQIVHDIRARIYQKTLAVIIASDPERKAALLEEVFTSRLLGPFNYSRYAPTHVEGIIRLMRMREAETELGDNPQ